MKIITAFMLALSFSVSANAQSLSPRGIRSSQELAPSKLLSIGVTKSEFPQSPSYISKQADFVYFPFSEPVEINQYPPIGQRLDLITSFAIGRESYDKAALYKQHLKLPGKFVFSGSLEVIPCNDLSYFIPEPIARNY
ncbi:MULTISPECIES: hypothetical protein [Olivibacter]|uniref:Uncharacterized protein n=1 Tax=Olivibacter jilunii TaxID=985016 RepID=A0ABW6AZN1_9SPHI